MLPGETNALPSDGVVESYTGSGMASAIDAMTVPSNSLLTAASRLGLSTIADLVGRTLEISQGAGIGRFWLITSVTVGPSTTALQLRNPTELAPEWALAGLPNSTSQFAVSSLSPNFFVNESTQLDAATVFNDGASLDQTGNLTATTITGIGMTGSVTYGNLELLEVYLGSGADTFSVSGTMKRDDGFRVVTLVNTGGGDDQVTVDLEAALDGFFALNTGAGNDHVMGSSSTLPLIIFGGSGDDQIQSGQGSDIVLGDEGRVDYRDGNGLLVTRLGLELAERTVIQPGAVESSTNDVPFKQTDGVARTPILVVTRGTSLGQDTIEAYSGNDLLLGGTQLTRFCRAVETTSCWATTVKSLRRREAVSMRPLGQMYVAARSSSHRSMRTNWWAAAMCSTVRRATT